MYVDERAELTKYKSICCELMFFHCIKDMLRNQVGGDKRSSSPHLYSFINHLIHLH